MPESSHHSFFVSLTPLGESVQSLMTSMMTTIFHNPRCSKSRAAVDLLERRGIEYKVVRYLENPPDKQELAKLVKLLGIHPEQLVRKGESLYKELGLNEQELSEQQWLEVLAANPKLIERPIVIHDGKAAIGRPIGKIEQLLDR